MADGEEDETHDLLTCRLGPQVKTFSFVLKRGRVGESGLANRSRHLEELTQKLSSKPCDRDIDALCRWADG